MREYTVFFTTQEGEYIERHVRVREIHDYIKFLESQGYFNVGYFEKFSWL
jgi:hypothetical protein